MVRLVVVYRNHTPACGREDRRAEREEPLGRFHRDEGAPVPHGGGSPQLVHRGEVDREGLPQKWVP
jgi:hypothetical protein